MSNYRRVWQAGGTYFFTVNILERKKDLLVRHIDALREAVRRVKRTHPFEIVAWVVLPDHLHCIWTLPEGDANFALRWRLIKLLFSKSLPKTERLSTSRNKNGERGIWQRRFWEHLLRDERDLEHHIHYVHRNPLKHGLVTQVKDWPYSTFHLYVQRAIYPENWCGGEPLNDVSVE
jgi:putative transposase